MIKKIIVVILGVAGLGLGISLCISAGFGIDPFTTFNNGLSNLTGITIGNMMLLSNIVVFGLMLLFYREGIHIGTVISAFGVGTAVNVFLPLVNNLNTGTIINRIIVATIGIIVVLVSIALYLAPDMGIAPWDSMGYMIQKVINASYSRIRTVVEVSALLIGIFLDAQYGVVTIILAFFLGPAIEYLGAIFKKALKFEN